ncbi:Hypothetical protein NGAL_HAMBI2605_38950 [Neorhizobium galegae bv. orientalis]|nr:Hypothetical protein NGAL_HAMBI2605_38950 [Neorhizobium galegae bv. orientalis]
MPNKNMKKWSRDVTERSDAMDLKDFGREPKH